MEDKIRCIDSAKSVDKIIDSLNAAPTDRVARTTATALLIRLRDTLLQTTNRGLCPIELPATPAPAGGPGRRGKREKARTN